MKKCALILGLILLSSGIVFARIHETYEIHRSYDCYQYGPYRYYRPHRINGHTHYKIYYPMTGVSVNVGGNYHSMGPVMRSIHYYHPPIRHRNNLSIRVNI